MIGIRRLADHLNISIGTVSRALNGRPDVNEETRKRVLEAAEQLGYVPNQSGRALRQGKTKSVGLIIESNEYIAENADNFFLGVINGLQNLLRQHDLDLVVLPCSTDEAPEDHLQRIVARRLVDAVIISSTQHHDKRIDMLVRSKIPFLALGRSLPGMKFPWIDLDFEGVATAGVNRLVANGHRRIAVAVGDTDINLGYVYHDAYRAALEANGLVYDPNLVIRAPSTVHGGHAVADWFVAQEQRPTAIMLVYELLAIGLYRRLGELGLQAGRDLAIVGFRDSPRTQFLTPSLTSFELSLGDLGKAMAEAILRVMDDPAKTQPPINDLWPMKLIPRESDTFPVG